MCVGVGERECEGGREKQRETVQRVEVEGWEAELGVNNLPGCQSRSTDVPVGRL